MQFDYLTKCQSQSYDANYTCTWCKWSLPRGTWTRSRNHDRYRGKVCSRKKNDKEKKEKEKEEKNGKGGEKWERRRKTGKEEKNGKGG